MSRQVIRLADLGDGALDALVEQLLKPRPSFKAQGFRPIAHGTYRGARQHYFRGVPLCGPCRVADRGYQAEQRAQARAKRGGTA